MPPSISPKYRRGVFSEAGEHNGKGNSPMVEPGTSRFAAASSAADRRKGGFGGRDTDSGRNGGNRGEGNEQAGSDAAARSGRERPGPEFEVAAHGSVRFAHRPTFAALDLGTNNCRLLIARPSGDDFVIVDAFSRIVRLGEGLIDSGRISDAAMQRAIDALSVCAEKLRRRRVHLSRAVATEACRRADNGAEFINRVREETGIALDIISAQEEARLAVMGCHQLLSPGNGPALIFDIGGGSTEIVLLDDSSGEPHIRDWQSIPWGVVSLTEIAAHNSEDEGARTAAYREMREQVRGAIRAFGDRLGAAANPGPNSGHTALRLLGTSGTVTTLASLYLNLPSYDRSQVDGLTVTTGDMRAVCSRLAAMALSEREQLACVGRERADLVVAGCAILEEIMDIWPAHSLNVADRGIREGVLRQLMHRHAHIHQGQQGQGPQGDEG